MSLFHDGGNRPCSVVIDMIPLLCVAIAMPSYTHILITCRLRHMSWHSRATCKLAGVPSRCV